MDSYSILRNNQEYGPYTLKDLSSQGLLSTDLIWVEGQSAAWRSPMEFDDLKAIIRDPGAKNYVKNIASVQPITEKATVRQKTFNSAPSVFVSKPIKPAVANSDISIPDAEASASFYDEKQSLKEKKKQSLLSYNFLSLGLLLIGAVMGAFIMKQMISSFGNEPVVSTGKAKEIASQTEPVSSSTHTAEASFATASGGTTGSVPVKKDSLAAKAKPSPKAPAAATVFKTEADNKAAGNTEQQLTLNVTDNNLVSGSSKIIKGDEIADEEAEKQTSAKNSVELSTNDYKVGLFGGVSGLQISVTNKTSLNIDNLLVEVEFLKPNGAVAKTEIVSVSNITAGASKTIAVPSSNRGVKIRYRVVTTNTPKETIATDNM